ncbi:MAG TPA: hypothetical protein VGB41_01260 [Acidimicrobiia bacterium]
MGLDVTRDARTAALSRLIDYAGLFPPARLAMESAVAGYRAGRGGGNAWMIDRFICPASRLTHLAAVLVATMDEWEDPWRVTVTADGGPDAVGSDALAVRAFDSQMNGSALIEVVETALPASDAGDWMIRAADVLERPVFFEIPWRDGATAALDSVVSTRETVGATLGAKLRCGGRVAEAFPPPGVVATVIAGCRDRELRLKATAGLHHPFRHFDPETGFSHHGFVNLLAASTAATGGADLVELTEIVGDTDPSSFALDQGGLTWRGHRFGGSTVTRNRERLFVGYGSCSFDEPVEDLTAIGVLPVGP